MQQKYPFFPVGENFWALEGFVSQKNIKKSSFDLLIKEDIRQQNAFLPEPEVIFDLLWPFCQQVRQVCLCLYIQYQILPVFCQTH